jgi:cytochrome b6-f complex iron-sulfur subunit
MNRRNFFKELPRSTMHAVQDIPPTATANQPSTMPIAGSPRQYHVGSRVLVEDAHAWLCCDELGFYAIDAHCPHLGCIVQVTEGEFRCGCHGSRFDEKGDYQSGPAKRGLRYLYVDLDSTGNLIIRRDRSAAPHDRFIA